MTRIVVTGAAGLVGQNLIARLKSDSGLSIVGIDKHHANTRTLRRLHPEIEVIEADLSVAGPWVTAFQDADAVIQLHAQIGGLDWREFEANNILATEKVLAAMTAAQVPYLVHVSSSVVNSMAVDFYTESKKTQEKLVVESRIPHAILRPTLMFGWFDRKHLGWLARFMKRVPVFPIPGSGRYMRQPLFALDFCDVIASCLRSTKQGAWNISGQEKIDYIDLIRAVKRATGARTPIIKIPYGLFRLLLQAYALVDRNPPFTTTQLEALVTPDSFEVIDWPAIFGVQSTPLDDALQTTFNDPTYAPIALDF
ncbi:NAD-dependent epimerase/dehydratase family protein [Thalassobaculum sp.]|uniref:NAD-dependent epimerase/dehydratase family protein n=1 Tax=Thalassobaculum sp. TaxID=2022740 RepID=UPI0032EF6596